MLRDFTLLAMFIVGSSASCGAFPGDEDRQAPRAVGGSASTAGAGAANNPARGGSSDAAGRAAGASGNSSAAGRGGSAGSEASVGGAPGSAGKPSTDRALLNVTFDAQPVGKYTHEQVQSEWRQALNWDDGLAEGRAEIVEGSKAFAGRSLCVKLLPNQIGPAEGGVQFVVPLSNSYDELYLSYRVQFASDFDFSKGGKLPGFSGGNNNTGGEKPNGSDGWSGRMMWRDAGAAIQYVYHVDQPSTFGEDMFWNKNGQRHFARGKWHSVEHHVIMNTPGQNDGSIEGWFDGKLAFQRSGLRFRDVSRFGIDAIYFSTFRGGSQSDWASSSVGTICFDEFIVSDARILE